MEATNEPDKARNSADAAPGRNSAGRNDAAHTPRIDSPSLVPGPGEPAAEARTAETQAKAAGAGGTALVVAAELRREQAGAAGARAKPWRLAKFSSLAASLALAVGVGAMAGALGTLGLQRTASSGQGGNPPTLQDSIARLTSELAALKAGVEASARNANGQLTKLGERIERAERAQSEPSSRLAKISEAVDRLEKRVQAAPVPPATIPAASPVAVPRGAASADVTGSIPDARKDMAQVIA